MKNTTLIIFGISLFVLFSLSSSLVSACDENEMQNIVTGSAIDNIDGINLGIILLVKELLIVVTLILLTIFLIKQIARNKQSKK